ncbi:MAG: polysaccharide deacetylase family protein [Acidobacteria bacterium]|nr:polysaccharide deacetylase family protein [Acidobacteriota bacterium]
MRAILTYHSIDASGSPISVAPDAFARHVAWLAGGRVSVEPLAAIAQGDDCAADGRDRVAITFDDAFENFGTVAWPRLRASGLPATVFVVSGHAGGTNRWGGVASPGIPELPLLTWEALGACAAAGADIGAHSRTHPHLSRTSAAARLDELAGCRDTIAARLGVTPESFAYPYGDCDASVVRDTAAVFARACTTEYRQVGVSDSVHRLPRLDMFYFQGPAALDDWGRPAFLRRIAMRRAARALRQWWTAPKSSSSTRAESL